MHVLGYLKRMLEYKIAYQRGSPENDGLTPIGFVDSSHGNDRTTGKSTMDYFLPWLVALFCGVLVHKRGWLFLLPMQNMLQLFMVASSPNGWVYSSINSSCSRTNLIHYGVTTTAP